MVVFWGLLLYDSYQGIGVVVLVGYQLSFVIDLEGFKHGTAFGFYGFEAGPQRIEFIRLVAGNEVFANFPVVGTGVGLLVVQRTKIQLPISTGTVRNITRC